jgi:hypothetical protein
MAVSDADPPPGATGRPYPPPGLRPGVGRGGGLRSLPARCRGQDSLRLLFDPLPSRHIARHCRNPLDRLSPLPAVRWTVSRSPSPIGLEIERCVVAETPAGIDGQGETTQTATAATHPQVSLIQHPCPPAGEERSSQLDLHGISGVLTTPPSREQGSIVTIELSVVRLGGLEPPTKSLGNWSGPDCGRQPVSLNVKQDKNLADVLSVAHCHGLSLLFASQCDWSVTADPMARLGT